MKKNKIFIIVFILKLILFWNFITMHYATDTYNIINMGYKDYAIKYSLNDGRVFMCLISLIADVINMPIQAYIIILTIIAIAVSVVSVLKIQSFVEKYHESKDKKNKYIILLIFYFTIFNFAFLENMQFAECAVMAISILLNIIIAKLIVEKNKNYILKSTILTVLSVLCYQGTASFLITITLFFSIIKGENIKNTIKNMFIAGLQIIFAVLIDLAEVRIVGKIFNMTATRMGSIEYIYMNIVFILWNIFIVIVNTFKLFPKYLYIIIILLLNIISLFSLKKQKNAYNVLALSIISILVTFAPNLISLAGFDTGRMSFSIGSSIGLVLLYIFINAKEEKIYKNIIITIAVMYSIVTIICYVTIMYEHKKVNMEDKENCITIGKWIEEYENETGITVENLVVVNNNNSNCYYNGIINKSSIVYKALYTAWSKIGVINYYTNRNFIGTASSKYDDYFANKKWDKLSKEQLVFDGNVVYFCNN